MDFVTVNLTPGTFFLNLQLQKVILKLQEIGYDLNREYDDFLLFKKSNSDVIKIRRDGSLSYKILAVDKGEKFLQKLFQELKLITQELNPLYNNLIDINEIIIYWPNNYDFNSLKFTNYSVDTSNIYDNKYISILKKKTMYSL
ncbi:hypothetical protein [Clostridium sp. UBA5712]|uniref:hypothetical protein n=1 Tax=Clostridium sp. UBA5712 TaxID=1946368 RepID=UPI00321719B4